MASDKTQQRAILHFCYKMGKSPMQTLEMINGTYGEKNVNRRLVYRWYQRFRDGNESLEDEVRMGRPVIQRKTSTSNGSLTPFLKTGELRFDTWMPCYRGEQRRKSDGRLDGKTALITGANTGLGKETAIELGARGARVLLACRSKSRAETAAEEVRERSGNPDVVVYILDLASLQSVWDCAAEIIKNEPRLDILINNAGVMWIPTRELTKDGFELQFGTNHLGPFLLTHLLLNLLKKSAPSRIVIVSSSTHMFGQVAIENLQCERSYNRFLAYCNSKLANLLHARELARRLQGSDVPANAVHPGMVMTGSTRSTPCHWRALVWCLTKWCGETAPEGATAIVHCAASPGVQGVSGKYFSGCREKAPTRIALDDVTARRLWEVSEDLVGLSDIT